MSGENSELYRAVIDELLSVIENITNVMIVVKEPECTIVSIANDNNTHRFRFFSIIFDELIVNIDDRATSQKISADLHDPNSIEYLKYEFAKMISNV